MNVEVLIFGAAADRAGSDRVTVVLHEATNGRTTVRNVLLGLAEQHPALGFALPNPDTGRLAVNQAFARNDHEIKLGDEVALVTLVGGG